MENDILKQKIQEVISQYNERQRLEQKLSGWLKDEIASLNKQIFGTDICKTCPNQFDGAIRGLNAKLMEIILNEPKVEEEIKEEVKPKRKKKDE